MEFLVPIAVRNSLLRPETFRHYHLITALCLLLSASPARAVDEDFDIPYTDTYGYVYDPDSGTYIQSATPETEPAPVASVTGNTMPKPASITPANPVTGEPTDTTGEPQGRGWLWFLATALILAIGYLGWLPRRSRPPHPSSTSRESN